MDHIKPSVHSYLRGASRQCFPDVFREAALVAIKGIRNEVALVGKRERQKSIPAKIWRGKAIFERKDGIEETARRSVANNNRNYTRG